MARDRREDMAKISRDLNRLTRAAMILGDMSMNNTKVTEDLTMLDTGYRFSANIPQDDFSVKMMELNENIQPSISSLNGHISEQVTFLNEEMAKCKAEQEEWEAEQKALEINNIKNRL